MVAPLSQMPRDLTRRAEAIDKAIERSKRGTLRAAGLAAKAEQLAVMRSDAGGDLRLSRVRSGKGATIGARFDLVGTDTVNVKAVGPVPLLANPTKPHTIPKQGARVRRQRRRLKFPSGDIIGGTVSHPGTKGKDTWNKGRDKAQSKVTTVVGRRTDAVVRRAFQSGG